MIVKAVFLLIMNKIEFHSVYNVNARVNASFDKNGTIHRKTRTTTPAPIKKSLEKIEEI